MTKRLFVGGLPYSVTTEQLNEIFSKAGKVTSANVIIDKFTGNSKGFGFVEFEDDKEADEAIKKLHDTEIEGRKITVNVARPLEDRGGQRNFDRPRFSRDSRGSDRGGRRFEGRR